MTTLETCCKNCLSVNTDGNALIFTGVLIDDRRYDVRIQCRDAHGNTIKVPENTQYLKETIEKVVDLSAQIFRNIASEARSKVSLSCEEGKHPIYQEADKKPVELKTEETKKVQDPLKEMLRLFREEQHIANLDPSQIIQVKWQTPSHWLPIPQERSHWKPCPPPPPASKPSTPADAPAAAKAPAAPTAPKKMNRKQLNAEAQAILKKPIDKMFDGAVWAATDEQLEKDPAQKKLTENLAALVHNPSSKEENLKSVRKWLSTYYRQVHELFQKHGKEAYDAAKSPLKFEEWCKEEAVREMFADESINFELISKLLSE